METKEVKMLQTHARLDYKEVNTIQPFCLKSQSRKLY